MGTDLAKDNPLNPSIITYCGLAETGVFEAAAAAAAATTGDGG